MAPKKTAKSAEKKSTGKNAKVKSGKSSKSKTKKRNTSPQDEVRHQSTGKRVALLVILCLLSLLLASSM